MQKETLIKNSNFQCKQNIHSSELLEADIWNSLPCKCTEGWKFLDISRGTWRSRLGSLKMSILGLVLEEGKSSEFGCWKKNGCRKGQSKFKILFYKILEEALKLRRDSREDLTFYSRIYKKLGWFQKTWRVLRFGSSGLYKILVALDLSVEEGVVDFGLEEFGSSRRLKMKPWNLGLSLEDTGGPRLNQEQKKVALEEALFPEDNDVSWI